MEKELGTFIQRLSAKPQTLILDIHVDGVNISESSSVGLWTILCTYLFLILYVLLGHFKVYLSVCYRITISTKIIITERTLH